MEIAKIMADFTPGAAGIWTLVAMMGLYLIREWRETRKLSAEDRLARRDGYAKETEGLRNECRALRSDLKSLQMLHDDYRRMCQKENDQLRSHIITIENELEGLKRKVATDALEIARVKGFGQ